MFYDLLTTLARASPTLKFQQGQPPLFSVLNPLSCTALKPGYKLIGTCHVPPPVGKSVIFHEDLSLFFSLCDNEE